LEKFRCKSCGRTFPAYAIKEEEKVTSPMTLGIGRVFVRKPCCPFCESIEIEEVQSINHIEKSIWEV